MGDPDYAGFVCQPTGVHHRFDGANDIRITDPAELAKLGFSIVSWEYPEPIHNSFSFGGISLSSEATIYTAVIAVIALLACMILIRKDKELRYGNLDKISILINFLVAIAAFPFILIFSCLSEIVADPSVLQQFLYVTPALTVLGLAASVTSRCMGYPKVSFLIQFIGPAIFVLLLFI